MNSAEIARFYMRVNRLTGRGITEAEAECLADDMVRTDRRPPPPTVGAEGGGKNSK